MMHYDEVPSLVDFETREQVFDAAVDQAEDGMIFIQIGSFLGASICRIASRLMEQKKQIYLYDIDTWEESYWGPDWNRLKKIYNVTRSFYDEYLHYINECGVADYINVVRKGSLEAVNDFDDKSVSFLFLDGPHGYGHCAEELKVWLPKMKDNSIVAGHDYPAGGVQRAAHETVRPVSKQFLHTTNNASYIAIFGAGIQ